MDTPTLATAIASLATALAVFADKYFERRRRKAAVATPAPDNTRAIAKAVSDHMEVKLERISSDVRELRAICIGVDGRNGLRGQLADVKSQLSAMQARELARLEAAR